MMEKLETTPSQTIGPFFAYSLTAEQYGYPFDSIVNDVLIGNPTVKERIYIKGRVFDGAGAIITDAMIELWHADSSGAYRKTHRNGKIDGFTGFGRLGTGARNRGQFLFTTIKPCATNGEAPHVNVILFMRGSLLHLYTRIYFSDEAEANMQDKMLNAVPPERRQTLIAEKNDVDGIAEYSFNIYMQGDNETVFFEL
jgi:protocatechuate 3,4-dioxygenase alpha subunit